LRGRRKENEANTPTVSIAHVRRVGGGGDTHTVLVLRARPRPSCNLDLLFPVTIRALQGAYLKKIFVAWRGLLKELRLDKEIHVDIAETISGRWVAPDNIQSLVAVDVGAGVTEEWVTAKQGVEIA
jgi:hypothetical protein